ncbi:MAG: hypothetical protein ACRED0_02855 [Gammaproteobacteria bacterium]
MFEGLIWRIRVTGIPDQYFGKLGALWVCETDYSAACAKLGATRYRWPKNPWSIGEEGLDVRPVTTPHEQQSGAEGAPQPAEVCSSVKRDAMAHEIEQAIREIGLNYTPEEVMNKLAGYAGKKGSCIVEVDRNCAIWRRDCGALESLTMNALKERLRRVKRHQGPRHHAKPTRPR